MPQDSKVKQKDAPKNFCFNFKKNSTVGLVIFLLAIFLFIGNKQASAQAVVTDPGATAAIIGEGTAITTAIGAQTAKQTASEVKATVKDKLWKIITKAASKAFNVTLRQALNKVAYDYATALGSGDWGQQPLFQVKNWGDYFLDVGDEMAGSFVEGFANDFSEENSAKMTEIGKQESVAYNSQQGCLKACGVSYQNKDPNCSGSMCERMSVTDTKSPAAVACQSKCRESYNETLKPLKAQRQALSKTPIATCQPSSIDVKLRIALGLTQVSRPAAPDCTASQMVTNWKSVADRYTDFNDPYYLKKLAPIFNPVSNDLGIYMTLKSDLLTKEQEKKVNETLQAQIGQGYTDKRNIAGNLIGIPNKSRLDTEASGQMYLDNFGKYTGDAFIDAANIFVNQAALTGFNKFMASLGQKAKTGSSYVKSNAGTEIRSSNCDPLTDPSCAPSNVGQGNVQEAAAALIKPSFTTQADYNILSSLSACSDPKNPGPTECVIDERFLEAITERKTVAEAIKEGFLNKNWLLSLDTQDVNSYNTRNISILRKYRILPVGWEEAANKSERLSKRATLMDLVSCFDPNDSYNEFGNEFDVRDQAWCEGLVDPNWVLKSPLGYCRKEGIGNQIQSTQIIPGQAAQGSVPATPSSLSLSRAENYCADEQTCIKEKSDGTCQAFGYCNSEKRTWSFGVDTCEPVNNTCQSFTKTNGTSAAYLKNTLDYSGCNADNSGCQAYSWFGVYDSVNNKVAWDVARKIYLNDKAGICAAEAEGCSSLYRVKPSWGANLIMNTNFDNDILGAATSTPCGNAGIALNDWNFKSATNNICSAEIMDISNLGGSSSNKALRLAITSGDIELYSDDLGHSLLPANFAFLPDQSYTLSADVYLVNGDRVDLWIGNTVTSPATAASTGLKDSWQHLSFTKTAADGINDPEFAVRAVAAGGPAEFYLKNLKFELSDYDTGYKLYGAYHVYEKILPPYLEAACYTNAGSGVNDYTLKPGAPAICSSFARKCNKAEAGCELYTSLDGFGVAAQTAPADYCPQECNGYDTYVSKKTYFNSPAAENLIPKTAQSCSAAAVGCNEFTNLDSVAQGGEQKEYYSFLKQCIKPDNNACGDFYVWGNATGSGYQLQALSLKFSAGDPFDPFVVETATDICNEQIFNALPSDASYNPDCRQYYSKNGTVSYHLASKTVTCSDDCKTYRQTAKNIEATVTSEAACTAGADSTTNHWDSVNNICYSCLNGGAWDNNQQACTYKAIPSEGTKCAAKDNGCREFDGNRGNNIRLVRFDDFESGASDWSANNATLALSSDSTNKDGHSLEFNPAASNGEMKTLLGNSVENQSSYVIKFLAKSASDTNLSVSFNDNTSANGRSLFGLPGATGAGSLTIRGDNEWHIYQVNLSGLNHQVRATETLNIGGANAFKIDNIILQEVSDKYYLISRSSQIPDICYYDMLDNYQGADYNLGCSVYSDRAGVSHNLHQFSHLCQDSAVGCEMMVNTQNSSSYAAQIYNDTNANGVCDNNEADCAKVSTDSIMYAVFDQAKQCNSADTGCARLGWAQKQGTSWYFSDVYKINNPDNYDRSLCSSAAVGCSQWQDATGAFNYFKDPGFNTCVYRNGNQGGAKAWFKVPVKRCDLNNDGKIKNATAYNEQAGAICLGESDCINGNKCIVDNNDYDCPVSYLKTIGYGGINNQIPTPDGAAGLCDAAASGCTEYIDPVSRFASNLVFNPNFEDLNSDGLTGDGWKNGPSFDGAAVAANEQIVSILAGKLYSFKFSDPINERALGFRCLNNFRLLGANNKFGEPVNNFKALANNAQLFLSPINNTCLLIGGDTKRNFELKEAIISYQKEGEVDKTSCNGTVNFDNGCVLFNERSQNGASGPADLQGTWNAVLSQDKNSPLACATTTVSNVNVCGRNSCQANQTLSFNTCNANQLIKVKPDRVCGSWLDCSSYSINPETKEKTCYAISQCDRLNDRQECVSFVKPAATSTLAHNFNFGNDKNTTGYSLLGAYYLPNMKQVGSDIGWHVDFESKATPLSCLKTDPLSGLPSAACIFDRNINADSIVSEPIGSPTDYPAHGAGYLKVLSYYQISPLASNACIPVVKNNNYYLNYLANTKNSGLKTKVTVTKCDANNTFISSYTDAAADGWERKVHKINPGNNNGIRIFLTSDAAASTRSEKYVYFDDLNIEPVLQINNSGDDAKDYVAKECRLYPAADSLTCLSQGENVISDGLFGYCLEHDKNNKNVCLMWYPVDNIGAGINRNNKANGYKGIFPLNYCTEMNGNFQLLEDRKTSLVHTACSQGQDQWVSCYINSPQGQAGSNQVKKEIGDFAWQCGLGASHNDNSKIFYGDDPDTISMIDGYCDHKDYWLYVQTVVGADGGSGSGSAYFCVPKNFSGWPSSNDLADTGNRISENNTQGEFAACSDNITLPASEGWYVYNGFSQAGLNEAKNHDPEIVVWDTLSKPRDSRNLTFIPFKDGDSNYNLTCNKFTQLVDSSGLNMAWSDRISKNSTWPYNTPTYLYSGQTDATRYTTTNGLIGYGRNRESIPFGAAALPSNFDLFGSTPIKFRDQFSQTAQESMFAGRPYGCTGPGCSNIGYCSGDPNVFCFSGDTYLNSRSCFGGSYGACVPLWSTPLNNTTDFKNILKSLFIKSYASYSLDNTATYAYDNSSTYDFAAGDLPKLNKCSGANNRLNAPQFCAVYPTISAVKLYYTNNNLDFMLNNFIAKIDTAGMYRLEFNTDIDPEQQPLKDIYIDWGDNNIQIINDQDSHPAGTPPHSIYHYYASTGNKQVILTVYDNWNRYFSTKAGSPVLQMDSGAAGDTP